MIREMETVMLTGFIYSQVCDITAWISNASLNRFYKISGNYKFEFEISDLQKSEEIYEGHNFFKIQRQLILNSLKCLEVGKKKGFTSSGSSLIQLVF